MKTFLPVTPTNYRPLSWRHRKCFVMLYCLCVVTGSLKPQYAQAQTIVQKVAEPFEAQSWIIGEDSTASGSAKLVGDSPAEIQASSKQSMVMEAQFSGGGFEYYHATPSQPLTIPGVTKSLSVWVRGDGQKNYGWTLQFKDGWGRNEVNGTKLEWEMSKGVQDGWKKVSFTVPADWVQPLTIDTVLVHNWEAKTTKATVRFWMDELQVATDISDVDPQTGLLKTWKPNPQPPADANNNATKQATQAPVTPLLTASLNATQLHNVFSGVQPEFVFRAHNWKADASTGQLEWKLSDYQNKLLKQGRQDIKVEDNFALSLPLAVQRYGLYHLDSTITWAGGKATPSSQPLAYIPTPHELSDQEKDDSPYGLNVLGARQPMVETFRKAGIIWYRDYSFNYEWMVRAKGADKSYSGWPWYPKMVRQYDASGVRVLANLQTAIKPPVAGAPPEPSLNWTREVVGMLLAFPSIHTFELDNEYDLGGEHIKAEAPINWQNYRNYHKKFGEIAHLLGGGQFTAVENGRAGIWPERIRQAVQSGDFAQIDVVNSHHYTGTEPPETNVMNYNMGIENSDTASLLFDQLRAAKKAGSSDGKPRQHWLTEFGWDTKAGPVVTPVEQAAYLARAYMMLPATGTEKGFWFFDLDSPNANQFFDGCGLFTYDQLPKLSYAAYAGLTQILPKPEYMGMINAGEGTWGYLYRNEGKLVAALWSLTGKQKPRITFESGKLYDFLANPIDTNTVQLGIEPVYAVGVAETSPWVRQAAYSLETPYLVSATAGDSITTNLHVQNRRATPINGKVQLQLPTGWQDVNGAKNISVAPGQTADIPLAFLISTEEPLGEKTVRLAISEGEPLHEIPLRVLVQRPIMMTVRGLQGEPGNSSVTIRVSNRSSQTLNGALHFKLPASWSASTPELKVEALKPKEVREIQTKVAWTPDWKTGETAAVEYRSEDGRAVQQPLIPSRLAIHPAPNLVLDGDIKDWPANTQLPAWVLGSTAGVANSTIHLAWSPKGLYVGLEVKDSKVLVPDPRSFWMGDVLELFVDTHDKKTARAYEPGDHQFWLVPQV
ncbi:MAG: hypothetical protein JOZ57_04215, partial [Abitibacteriaceae bacterium]|nr:hypothetical protein [Abditibacteriaceae bacterium]